jgi:starch synthase (maltosyl-transferring)
MSFPESHDTERLATELNCRSGGGEDALCFRGAIRGRRDHAVGFEIGFSRRPRIVKTRTADWEILAGDICDFIMAVNRIGQSRRVFDEEGPIDVISLGNANLFTLVKWTRDRSERALIAINRNGSLPQSSSMRAAGHSLRAPAARIKLSRRHPWTFS